MMLIMKILIADDHELYRDALLLLISRIKSTAEISCCCDFSELTQQLSNDDNWDAVLIDLNMPYLNGWDDIKHLVHTYQTTAFIVITSSDAPSDTQRAMEVGALGYIVKSMSSDDMLKSLSLMLENGVSIHPVTKAATKPDDSLFSELTPRQYEVLKHICKGASNKRIALDLELSESTVKLHVRAILRALSVSNRTEAALLAKQALDINE